MSQSLITTAAQHLSPVADMRSQLEYVAQFVRHKPYAAEFARDANLLLRSTEQTLRERGNTFTPHVPQLCNALIYLAAIGVSLNPCRKEATLLPFWKQKDDKTGIGGYHEITPDVMKHGLIRLAAEMYPIRDFTAQIVMQGDLWDYRETARGPSMEWAPGKDRAVLTNMSDLMPIAGAWCRVDLWDRASGREWQVLGVLVGDDFREKIRTNRNATKPKTGSAWSQHKIAMLQKTILRYTLQHKLPLTGEPALAFSLMAESESHSRALLGEYAAQRGLELPEATEPAPVPAARRLIDAAPEIPDSEPRTPRQIRDEILACTDAARLDGLEDEIALRNEAEKKYLLNVLADKRAKMEEQ